MDLGGANGRLEAIGECAERWIALINGIVG